MVLPRIVKYKVLLIDSSTSLDELNLWHTKYEVKNYFGGDKLRSLLDEAGLNEVPIYRVNAKSPSEYCYPLKIVDARVVAMSMPHPSAVTKTNQFQAGWKEEFYGRVLPGYQVKKGDEKSIILDPQNGKVLVGAPLDDNGFMAVK